jgi:hypothetical protein
VQENGRTKETSLPSNFSKNLTNSSFKNLLNVHPATDHTGTTTVSTTSTTSTNSADAVDVAVFFTVEKNAKRSTGRNTKRCASDYKIIFLKM